MPWFVFAVASAFFASLASIVEKRTLTRIHSTDFSFATALLIAIASLPFLLTAPLPLISGRALLAIYAASVLAAFAFLEVTKGVRHMEISSSAPLFLLSPFLTAIMAYIALDESLSRIQLAGMGLIALGTYVLETTRLRNFREFIGHFTGDKYARQIVLGLFFYSITATIDRTVLGSWDIPPLLYVAIIHIFIAFNFGILWMWQKRGLLHLIEVFRSAFAPLLLVALLTIGYRAMYSFAVGAAAVALVISIKRSSSLFTTVIGGGLFHDHALLRRSVACAIMIVGVVTMAL